MTSLFARFRAAVDAFRDPSTTDKTISTTVEMDEDKMRNVVEGTLADAFRQFDAPDVDAKVSGLVDPYTAELIGDLVRKDTPDVPDDARVQRIVLDAPDEATVYFDFAPETDPHQTDVGDWQGGSE